MVLIGPHPAHSQTREAPRQLLPHRRMFQSYLTAHVGLHGAQWGSNAPTPPRWDGSARAGGGAAESTRLDPGLQQTSMQEPAISPDWPGGVKELGAGMDPPGHWITPAEIPLGLPERRRGWMAPGKGLGVAWGRRRISSWGHTGPSQCPGRSIPNHWWCLGINGRTRLVWGE